MHSTLQNPFFWFSLLFLSVIFSLFFFFFYQFQLLGLYQGAITHSSLEPEVLLNALQDKWAQNRNEIQPKAEWTDTSNNKKRHPISAFCVFVFWHLILKIHISSEVFRYVIAIQKKNLK